MKFLNINGLTYFLSKLDNRFVSRSEFGDVVKLHDTITGNRISANQIYNWHPDSKEGDNHDLILGNNNGQDSYIQIDSTKSDASDGNDKRGNIYIKSKNTVNVDVDSGFHVNYISPHTDDGFNTVYNSASLNIGDCGLSLNLDPIAQDSKPDDNIRLKSVFLKMSRDKGVSICGGEKNDSNNIYGSIKLNGGNVTFNANSDGFGRYTVIKQDYFAFYGRSVHEDDLKAVIEAKDSEYDGTAQVKLLSTYNSAAFTINPTQLKLFGKSLELQKDRNIKFRTSSSNTMRLTEGEGFKVFANMYAEPDHATDIAEYSDEEKTILSSNTVQKNILDLNKKIYDVIDSGMLDDVSYGVEWTEGTANSELTRVGNMSYHKTLPIQSKIRGCVHQHGKIQYYLDPNDWSKKADGSASRLDGYDGEVGLEIPKFYIWSYTKDGTCGVRISKNKFVSEAKEAGGYILAPWCASLLREVPENMGYLSTLPKNSLVCIKNGNTYCRGGNNNATYDTYYTAKTDIYRSQLNKPATALNRATARTYAKNGGNLLLGYHEYKDLVWLYYIEYANFDCQTNYNATPTSEGYKQGGLGAGCTTFDWNMWTRYNANYPTIPNGELCEQFGNNTGFGGIKIPSFSYENDGETKNVAAFDLKCAYYRGIQNFFGDCWQNLDRIITTYNSETQKRDVYITDNTEFADNTSKMTKISSIPTTNGWVNTLYIGNSAELLPNQINEGGSSHSPVKDYCYSNDDNTPHIFCVGGDASFGGKAGLASSYSVNGLGHAYSNVAFRTMTKTEE